MEEDHITFFSKFLRIKIVFKLTMAIGPSKYRFKFKKANRHRSIYVVLISYQCKIIAKYNGNCVNNTF